MANTNQLKYIIEPEMQRRFCEIYCCDLISLTNNQLKDIFNDMEPDFIFY